MNWVIIHRSNGVTEAEILKNMLESFGIPARVSAEAYGKVLGMTVDGLGVASLLVPARPGHGSPGHPGRAFHGRSLEEPPPEAV